MSRPGCRHRLIACCSSSRSSSRSPLFIDDFRDVQFAYVGDLLHRRCSASSSSPASPGRSRSARAASWRIGAYTTAILVVDHGWRDLLTHPARRARRRRRSASSSASRRCGSPASTSRSRRSRSPCRFIALAKRFPQLHRRQRRHAPARCRRARRLAHDPTIGSTTSRWAIALAILFVLAWLLVARQAGPRAPGDPRERDRRDCVGHQTRARTRRWRSGSRRSSPASPASLYAILSRARHPGHVPDRRSRSCCWSASSSAGSAR